MKNIFRILGVCAIVLSLAFTACDDGTGDPPGGTVTYNSVPDALKVVIGRGYDVTERYAYSPDIKQTVLDLNKLASDGRVFKDPNSRRADYSTVTGETITEYQESLSVKASVSASVGVAKIASFSSEVGASFGSDKAQREGFAYATHSSNIVSDSYFVENNDLSGYVTSSFIDYVKTKTPAEVITRYGTHVMLGGVLGARLDYNFTSKKLSTSSSTSIGAYANAKFDATFKGVTVGGGGSSSVDTQFQNAYDTSLTEFKTNVFGGKPQFAQYVHDSGSYEAWINSIEGNEIWCDYYPNTLISISDFVTVDIFGEDAATLQTALINYCTSYLDGKKITVTASVKSDSKYIQGWTTNGGTVTKLQGDNDVFTQAGDNTSWKILVEFRITGTGTTKNIAADFTYTVTEDAANNATILQIKKTVDIPINKNIESIAAPSSWLASGTISGKNYNWTEVLTDNETQCPVLFWTSVRVDSDNDDDRGYIGATGDLKVYYSYRE